MENKIVLKHTFWGGGIRRAIGKLVRLPLVLLISLAGIFLIVSQSPYSTETILGIIILVFFGIFALLIFFVDFIPMIKKEPIATLSDKGVDVHAIDHPIIPWKNIINIVYHKSYKGGAETVVVYFCYEDELQESEAITIFTDYTSYTCEQVVEIMEKFIALNKSLLLQNT